MFTNEDLLQNNKDENTLLETSQLSSVPDKEITLS